MKTIHTLKKLFTYTGDELFYKNYYEAKKNHILKGFLDQYDPQELRDRKLIVPEIDHYWNPTMMDDEMLYLVDDPNDVIISKHNRYTPVFAHKHTFFEMVYVINGQCHQCINGHELNLSSGQLCIIAPLVTHSIGVFDDSIVLNIIVRRKTFENVFYTLLQNSNKITSFVNQSLYLYQQANYLIADTHEDEEILKLILALYDQHEEENLHYDLVLNTQLMYILSLILQRYEDTIDLPQKPFHGNKTLLDIVSYVEEHFKTISLQEVATHFNYSPSYVSRLIKKETGISFKEITLNIKFDRARGLLETTNKSIEEIASLVGFENSENFYRLFKKTFSMTPGQYRKQSQN